jgi:hypothetical protein
VLLTWSGGGDHGLPFRAATQNVCDETLQEYTVVNDDGANEAQTLIVQSEAYHCELLQHRLRYMGR